MTKRYFFYNQTNSINLFKSLFYIKTYLQTIFNSNNIVKDNRNN